MKGSVIGIIVLCFVPLVAFAQNNDATDTSTSVPSYARFEIIQSPMLAKLTIRLDRFTGKTWQLTKAKDGSLFWQPMERIKSKNDDKIAGKVNYQIFASGMLAQITILMNTNTGASWIINEDPKVGDFWAPMNSF